MKNATLHNLITAVALFIGVGLLYTIVTNPTVFTATGSSIGSVGLSLAITGSLLIIFFGIGGITTAA